MQGLRESPSVSVNKLGRYLMATPALRKRLIHEQKHPPDPQYLRYLEAEQALRDFLCHGQERTRLAAWQERLAETQPQSEYDAHRLELCLEALERFEHVLPHLQLEGLVLEEPSGLPETLELAGVSIRMRPQAVVHESGPGGRRRSGVLKLYFAKHHPLHERSGQYIASLLQLYAERHLGGPGRVDERLVRVVDVFAGEVFTAPRARTRRLSDAELACEEIAARWPLQ
jgi:hypothetical protein